MNLMTMNLYKGFNRNNSNLITFKASTAPEPQKTENTSINVDPKLAALLTSLSAKHSMTISDLIKSQISNKVEPEKSITAQVGRTNVTTLIDGEQIFKRALKEVKAAKKSIQIEMFEFQNKDDFDKHPQGGAETVKGSKQQQQLYDEIIKKRHEGVKVQVILDASKWAGDADGKGGKFYNNLKMAKRLLDEGVDVAIYPRSSQGGTKIQHVKLLAVDSNKVMIGGENWGNHSPVNHDACVLIQTQNKFKGQGSEVDNIIDTLFNKDWQFSCKMMGLYGAMTEKETHPNLKIIQREILPEAKEYMAVIGNLFNDPKYKEKLKAPEFCSPEVKPVKNPAIKVLVNSPSEYLDNEIYPKDFDNESIRTHLLGKKDDKGNEIEKGKLNDPNVNYLRAELFVLSHKEIVEKIIERHKAKTLDAKILVSPDLLEKFPFLNKPYQKLREAGVPTETFKVNEELHQRLHCKWAVLGHKDEKKLDNLELLIGSANWSAAGLENNSKTGIRSDYKLDNAKLLNKINHSYRTSVEAAENEVRKNKEICPVNKLQSIFTPRVKVEGEKAVLDYKVLSANLKANKKSLNAREKALFIGQAEQGENHEKALASIRKLQGCYQLVGESLNRLTKYKRGNHEGAIVISNDAIAQTFVRQFEKDWKYTQIKKEPIAFTANNKLHNTLYLPVKSNSPVKLDSSGLILNKVI